MELPLNELHDVCFDCAQKMSDIDALVAISLSEKNKCPDLYASTWDGVTLASGYPGLICLYSEMEHWFPDPKWSLLSHNCIERLIKEIEGHKTISASMFTGYAGICMGIYQASQGGSQYRNLHYKLHGHLLKCIRINYLEPLQHVIADRKPCPPQLYDVISGISGMLPYLLIFSKDVDTHVIIVKILEILVALTHLIEVQGNHVPGWFILPKYFVAIQGNSNTYGCFDTGAAHGIAGCLTGLSQAILHDIEIPGQKDAIEAIVKWLKDQRCNLINFKQVWPDLFRPESKDSKLEIVSGYRDGWCRGAPGIIWALFTASRALEDEALENYATEAMIDLNERIENQNTLDCHSFCHGLSAPMVMMQQMYLRTRKPFFLEASQRISKSILSKYSEEYPFGFKCTVHPDNKPPFIYDNPGLLDGTIGTVLSLLFQKSDHPRPWLNIFMLN